MSNGCQRKVEVPRTEEKGFQLVSQGQGVATMLTVGMFPSIQFCIYVLNFVFKIFPLVWLLSCVRIIIRDSTRCYIDYSDGVT